TNSKANARSIAPPAPWANPWSIMMRNAWGRLRVAVEEQASANSQAMNSPRCRLTNGQRVRRLPIGAFSALAPAPAFTVGAVEASFIPPLSAITGRRRRLPGHGWHRAGGRAAHRRGRLAGAA